MNELSKSEQEELRHVVLEVLAARHPAALAPTVIGRHVKTAIGIERPAPAIESALEILRGLAFVTFELDPLGSTKYWSATAAGVLQYERGQG